MYLVIVYHLLLFKFNCSLLNVKYGHVYVHVSHGCLATTQLWKIGPLYDLYSAVARQQGTHLMNALLML